jgi:hypothetical protein
MRQLALGAALIAVAGCGSSGMSDNEYREKADAICASITAQRDRLTPASNLEELRAVAQSTIAINTDALRRFKELEPPGDLKAAHRTIVGRLDEMLRLQQQALTTDPKSPAGQQINANAVTARAGLVNAAQQAKLQACEQL